MGVWIKILSWGAMIRGLEGSGLDAYRDTCKAL